VSLFSKLSKAVGRVAKVALPLAITAFAPGAAGIVRAFQTGGAAEAPSSMLDYFPSSTKVRDAVRPLIEAAAEEIGSFREEVGPGIPSYVAGIAQRGLGQLVDLTEDDGFQEEVMDDEEEEE